MRFLSELLVSTTLRSEEPGDLSLVTSPWLERDPRDLRSSPQEYVLELICIFNQAVLREPPLLTELTWCEKVPLRHSALCVEGHRICSLKVN